MVARAELHKGEFARAIDGDKEIELAFGGLDFGDVDVKIADRIGLELLLGGLVAFDLRQPGDAVALQAAMQRRTRKMRDRRLQGVEAIVERQQGVPRKATMIASSSTVRTVDFGAFGPVFRSAVEARFFHFPTVFGLIP